VRPARLWQMPRPPVIPPELRHGPFLAAAAIDAGLLTKAQLRSAAWIRLSRGVYIDSSVVVTHLVRIAGANLVLPPDAVVSGRSAAVMWGVAMDDLDVPVDVLTPRQFGPVAGLAIRTGRVPDHDVTTRRGTHITTPLRTAWELARILPEPVAVEWIDALARRRRLSRAALATEAARRAGTHGSRRAARTLAMCDPRAESAAESRLRLHLMAAGLPIATPHYDVAIAGGRVANVDFAWPAIRFAVEAGNQASGGDRKQLRALVDAGWEVVPVTSDDMLDVDVLIRKLAFAYEQRIAGFTGKVR
jgi:hypothetical protein